MSINTGETKENWPSHPALIKSSVNFYTDAAILPHHFLNQTNAYPSLKSGAIPHPHRFESRIMKPAEQMELYQPYHRHRKMQACQSLIASVSYRTGPSDILYIGSLIDADTSEQRCRFCCPFLVPTPASLQTALRIHLIW